MPSEPPSPKSKNIFNRIASAFHNEELSDRDDLIEVLKEAKSHNLIAADTFSMIEGALSVSDLRASDIMVPRSQVQALDLLEAARPLRLHSEIRIRLLPESPLHGELRFQAVRCGCRPH